MNYKIKILLIILSAVHSYKCCAGWFDMAKNTAHNWGKQQISNTAQYVQQNPKEALAIAAGTAGLVGAGLYFGPKLQAMEKNLYENLAIYYKNTISVLRALSPDTKREDALKQITAFASNLTIEENKLPGVLRWSGFRNYSYIKLKNEAINHFKIYIEVQFNKGETLTKEIKKEAAKLK